MKIELRAAQRLKLDLKANKFSISADVGPLKDEKEREAKALAVFQSLRSRRVPVTLNKVDHSIGCTVEADGLIQALRLLGWTQEQGDRSGVFLGKGADVIRVIRPRPEWNPVIQIVL